MSFRDNIGVQEELRVELLDYSNVAVSREQLVALKVRLELLRDPMNERPALEDIIREVNELLK